MSPPLRSLLAPGSSSQAYVYSSVNSLQSTHPVHEYQKEMTQQLPGRSSHRSWQRTLFHSLVALLSPHTPFPLMLEVPAGCLRISIHHERGWGEQFIQREKGSSKRHPTSHQSTATGPSLHQKTELTSVTCAGLNLHPASACQELTMEKRLIFPCE